MNATFDSKFFNLYKLQKTLRFELKPIGETAAFLEDFKNEGLKQVVAQDEKRAEDYQAVKQIIDDYHRDFIEQSLAFIGEHFKEEDLNKAFEYYQSLKKAKAEDKLTAQKQWQDYQKQLRLNLVKCFTASNKARFSRIDKKELIKEDLIAWLTEKGRIDQILIVETFGNFTTYFTGFHENRKNIYSKEDHTTAIANRVVHENLPKYFDNVQSFEKLKDQFPELKFDKVKEDLELQIELESAFEVKNFTDFVTQSGIDLYNYILGGKTLEDGTKKQGVNEQINLFKQQQTREIARQIPKLIPLFKQILSERTESRSFIPVQFESDNELFESIKQLNEKVKTEFPKLQDSLLTLADADLSKVYLKTSDLNSLSNNIYSNYAVFSDALNLHKDNLNSKKAKDAFEKLNAHSLKNLLEYLERLNKTLDTDKEYDLNEEQV